MKTKIVQSLLIAFIAMLWVNTASGQFPTETQLTKIDMIKGLPTPVYLDTIIDPVYGSAITRISDETVFGPTQVGPTDWWAPYRRHRWFKMQPWNADGSRILVDLTYPNYLVDGSTYKLIKRYDPTKPTRHPPTEAIWSNVNPDIMYGISGNSLIKYKVSSTIRTTMHTFSEYNAISIGLYEGNVSNDDKYVALWCPKGGRYFTVVYDMQADSVYSTYEMGPQGQQDYYETFGLNWVCISQTGKYVVIQWQRSGSGRDMGVEVFDNKMNFIRQVTGTVKNAYNIDMGLDVDGNDIVVYQNLSTCDIMTQRLSDGKITKVLSGSKISKATTISCRNVQRPGWAYFGDFEAGPGSVAEFHAAGTSEKSKASYNTVFALKLDGSETVQVYSHMHHSTNEGLYVQPMPVPSPDGKKVMFASDWEEEDMSVAYEGGPFKYTRVYDYVAEYLAPTIPGGITASDYTDVGFTLSWNKSTDDDAGIYYVVYKDGDSIGTTITTSLVVSGLSSHTTYAMTVKAINAMNNISPASQVFNVTTGTTGIRQPNRSTEAFNVSVFPNPVSDEGTITISFALTDDYLISVYDITGRKLIEKQVQGHNYRFEDLNVFQKRTLYILKVANSKNQNVVKKIIIN